MRLRRIAAASLLMLFLPQAQAGRIVEFDDPMSVAVPPNANPADLERVVRGALEGRKWQIRDAGPGAVEAQQVRKDFHAKIRISWGQGRVMIKYVDSSGLDYGVDGRRQYIHRHYVKWIDFLVRDISAGLQPQPAFK